MKQRLTIIAMFLLGITVLSFIGSLIFETSKRPKEVPIENAKELYLNAAKAFQQNQDIELTIHQTSEITVNGSVFHESSERIVQYDVQPSGDTSTYLHEILKSGTHSTEISECFSAGKLFTTVNGAAFMSSVDPIQYTSTLLPLIILNPELYKAVTGVDTGTNYVLTFSEPLQIEQWLSDESITLHDATGKATVNYNGLLIDSIYTVSYEKNGIPHRSAVKLTATHKPIEVLTPKNTDHYTPISYWEAPKALERACGFLIQTDRISSEYADLVYFQAIGDKRTQKISLHAQNDENLAVSILTETALTNDTKQEQNVSHVKQEYFINEQYSISTNGEPPVMNADIHADTMNNYFQDIIVSTIMLPEYIASADIEENETSIQITFTGNDEFALFLTENACQVLYQNPTLITESGNTITAKKLQCYLTIDKKTGLPSSSGIDFLGSYKTQGIPYEIQYSAEQSYTIPSSNAINKINEAAGK